MSLPRCQSCASLMIYPFRQPILSATPSPESIGRGFLFALTIVSWYILVQSPRNGKLLATWTTLRKNRRCSHRSDEKAADAAAVSCVGRFRQGSRNVADTPRQQRRRVAPLRRTNGDRHFPLSRLTHRNKSRLRRTATWSAMRRKSLVRCYSTALRTKDPQFGFTERAAFGVECSRQTSRTQNYRWPAECMAGHVSGVRSIACAPFFWLNQAVNSLFSRLSFASEQ